MWPDDLFHGVNLCKRAQQKLKPDVKTLKNNRRKRAKEMKTFDPQAWRWPVASEDTLHFKCSPSSCGHCLTWSKGCRCKKAHWNPLLIVTLCSVWELFATLYRYSATQMFHSRSWVLSLLSGAWGVCCWIQGMDLKETYLDSPGCSHPQNFKWLFNLCVCAICLFVFCFYRFGVSGRFIKDDIKSSWDHWELFWPTWNHIKKNQELKTANRSMSCLDHTFLWALFMELPLIAAGSASSGSAERPRLYWACMFSVSL